MSTQKPQQLSGPWHSPPSPQGMPRSGIKSGLRSGIRSGARSGLSGASTAASLPVSAGASASAPPSGLGFPPALQAASTPNATTAPRDRSRPPPDRMGASLPGEPLRHQHEGLARQGPVPLDLHLAAQERLHGRDGLRAQAVVGGAVDLHGGAGPPGADPLLGEGEIQGPAPPPLPVDLERDPPRHLIQQGHVAPVEEQQI